MREFLHNLLGDEGERAAARYLQQQGYRILKRQFRNRYGEIDIIALDDRQIVFVEVKTRRRTDTGQPFEAVDRHKQHRIARTALAWLKDNRRLEQSCRFDVISIVWQSDDTPPQIDHFRHAFEAPDSGQITG